jgi:hypothetical protein
MMVVVNTESKFHLNYTYKTLCLKAKISEEDQLDSSNIFDVFSFIKYRLEKKQMNRILATTITNIYRIKLKIMLLNFINLPIIFRIYTFVRSCQFIVRFYLESKKLR